MYSEEYNKELCKRFPFLKITANEWGVNVPEDYYEFTWLDDMPEGWRETFGEQMCQEIMNVLVEEDILHEYQIIQIKSKYGSLRWYDTGCGASLDDIKEKYAELSRTTCPECGKPAKYISINGWIDPYCEECAKEYYKRQVENCGERKFEEYFTPIKDYYK